jgi:hypothetical protein
MADMFSTPSTSNIVQDNTPQRPIRVTRIMQMTMPAASVGTDRFIFNSPDGMVSTPLPKESDPLWLGGRGTGAASRSSKRCSVSPEQPDGNPTKRQQTETAKVDSKDTDPTLRARREQLAMDAGIAYVPSYNPSIVIRNYFGGTFDSENMRKFTAMIPKECEAANTLQLIAGCCLKEKLYTINTVYATLARMPKHEIATMADHKARTKYWVKKKIGLWEVAMGTMFQVTYRDVPMDFRGICESEDRDFVSMTKLSLCKFVNMPSVVGLIHSTLVDHLLWKCTYPVIHISTVVNVFNYLAKVCTEDFSSSPKETFLLWQSLCAYVACVEILKLQGTGRHLNQDLMVELRRVLGIDEWLAVGVNATRCEELFTVYTRASNKMEMEFH